MVLRRPAMNRSCNRENPDILIVMIAEKQIMRGDGDDKERETMGPQKPAREMSGTAPKSNCFPISFPSFLSPSTCFTLSLQFSLHEGVHFMHPQKLFFLAFCYPLSCFLETVYKVCWSTLYYRVCLFLGDHHSANVNKKYKPSRLSELRIVQLWNADYSSVVHDLQ
uniref:Uncharacterized protein n=1 Tax=Salix viminalis TaxID=40686 RepID=A0A6N2NFR9_SALVM